MNLHDIARLGLSDGDGAGLSKAAGDGVVRELGFRVTAHSIPKGSIGADYPECNALIPLWHHSPKSLVPGPKATPVRISRSPSFSGSGQE